MQNSTQMIYDSPLLHTVVLRNLTAGATYHYQVANDGRNFSFTMPLNGDAYLSIYGCVLPPCSL